MKKMSGTGFKGMVLAAAMLTAGMICGCGGSSSSAAPAASHSQVEETASAVETESVEMETGSSEYETYETVEHADTEAAFDEEQEESLNASDATAEATEENAMIANPWMDTVDLDEAAADSGVDFVPPEADYIGGFENMALQGYRSMSGTIEADYSNGTDEVCVRKSSDLSGDDLAGDYNEYSEQWEVQAMGVTVNCKGDGSLINVATFGTDEYSYSILCNPGREGSGMDAEALQRILQFMQ